MKRIVIYLDAYFITNFIMDFCVLCTVSFLIKKKFIFLRLLASTTLGAAWSVFVLVMPLASRKILNICTYTLISFLMIEVCIRKCELKDAVKGTITMLLVAFLYGGIVHFLYYYTFAGFLVNSVLMGTGKRVLILTLSVVIVSTALVLLGKRLEISRRRCEVVIEFENEQIRLNALIDSGNLLVDSYSGKPVTIVEKALLDRIVNKINDYERLKYHMIPYSSLGCENGVIEIILADNMYIYTGKRKKAVRCAAIGLCEHRLSSNGEYNCLISSKILE